MGLGAVVEAEALSEAVPHQLHQALRLRHTVLLLRPSYDLVRVRVKVEWRVVSGEW